VSITSLGLDQLESLLGNTDKNTIEVSMFFPMEGRPIE